MNPSTAAALDRIRPSRWLALPVSTALGLLLAAALLALLAPRPGVAAAAPAVAYSCDEPGLIAALGAGGSATFTCGGPVTVTLSSRKTVTRDVTLDGGSKLTLSGGGVSGIFSVPVGVHFTVLNITLFNAGVGGNGGAIYNSGFATITHTHFFSNFAPGGAGAALYNAAGATAFIGNSLVDWNRNQGGAVWSGDPDFVTGTATLTIVHTTFEKNLAADGGAVVAGNGPTWITGSTFYANQAFLGGAIYAASNLRVDNSLFISNTALLPSIGLDHSSLLGPRRPELSQFAAGGAIALQQSASGLVANSYFTGNVSSSQGGAILFEIFAANSTAAGNSTAALSAPVQPGSLLITGSSFYANCTGGSGGAIANSLTTTVVNSSFALNRADSGDNPCLPVQASRGTVKPAAPALPSGSAVGGYIGAGGAIYNFQRLTVTGTVFLTNTATVTTAGGGGAIAASIYGEVHVDSSQFYGNRALNDGGAIFADLLSDVFISGSDFRRNIAQLDAGGAIASVGHLAVSGSTFIANNGAPAINHLLGGGGGAIFASLPFFADGLRSGNGAAGSQPQIQVSSRLLVDHSTFISNSSEYEGGAIDASDAGILASTFVSNSAAYGGAIDVFNNNVAITASTFIANAAITTTFSGASEGGAIDTNGNIVSIINSTFYANRAEGGAEGGAINGGSVVLQNAPDGSLVSLVITNSTFISNSVATPGSGGAFSQNSGFLVHNVLIAYNQGGNCQGILILSGANLEYPGTTCGGASVQADPKALAPAANGGPTLTSALRPTSPAIDTGDNAGCPAFDQRGLHRPINGDNIGGATCDIGAFEALLRLFLPLLTR